MLTYKYSLISIADLFEIMKIEHRYFPDTLTIFHEAMYNLSNNKLSFKCKNHEIVGFVKSQYIPSQRTGVIDVLCVAKEHRRNRIGTTLIQKSIFAMKKEFPEINHVWLMASVSNIPAINLYKSMGFIYAEIIVNAYREGSDAIKMIYQIEK